MPAPNVHHPKSFEPTFEHVYVTVPDDDRTRDRPLTDVHVLHSNLMVDTFIANADPEEYARAPSPFHETPTHTHTPQAERNRPESASLITSQRLRKAGHHRSQSPETQALHPRITRYATVPHLQRRLVTTC